jgi:hypothetical protein
MPEGPIENPDETIQNIRANARLVVSQLGATCDFEFAFDDKSVEWLDGFIERLRNGPMNQEQQENWVSNLGSFLGEAIRASYGGIWTLNESGWQIQFNEKNAVFPFNKVRKQLQFGPEDSILSFYRTIPLVFSLRTPNALPAAPTLKPFSLRAWLRSLFRARG